jgi:hypothetical protein
MENYWIPFDEYKIKAKEDEEFPLPSSWLGKKLLKVQPTSQDPNLPRAQTE